MSAINVSNLTFSYDNGWNEIFSDVSFVIDSDWKLGLIGRNGKGKTTLMKLLMGQYEYSGKIKSSVAFDYFPFKVENAERYTYEIIEEIYPDYEEWRVAKELNSLNMDIEALYRPFNTLSKGEQTKVMLAVLFSKENNFLLIDEPTNHLDYGARQLVAKYLNSKKGFILISHDRTFLDSCVDHIMAINRSTIEVQAGNFSSWWENKQRQDQSELKENEKLKKDIKRLEESARQTASWSNQVEASKYHTPDDRFVDKGYIGHKSAKMMKRSMNIQNRIETEIEKKSGLLKNIETTESLKMQNLSSGKDRLIVFAKGLSASYDGREILRDVSFEVQNGDRLLLQGRNGSGKSTIIKLILGQQIKHNGLLKVPQNLKVSYISQDTSWLQGSLSEFVEENKLDPTLFRAVLRKLDFEREQFDLKIENYSEGQKKKLLIAKSLCEPADLYLWDEPLNYIDIFSRMQIEELISEFKPTMVFVEHDKSFAEYISTKVLALDKKKQILKDEGGLENE